MLDLTETGADQIKTYDLFALIANAELEICDEDEFWAMVERYRLPSNPIRRQEPMAFYRLRGFRPERTNFCIKLQQDLLNWSAERFGRAILVDGVTLEPDFPGSVPGLNQINQRLRRRLLPTLLCLGQPPQELKRRLRLPLLFPLHHLKSRDGVEQATVAFGREALLLDVALKYSGIDCSSGATMIF